MALIYRAHFALIAGADPQLQRRQHLRALRFHQHLAGHPRKGKPHPHRRRLRHLRAHPAPPQVSRLQGAARRNAGGTRRRHPACEAALPGVPHPGARGRRLRGGRHHRHARQTRRTRRLRVFMVTPDKDFAQLISGQTRMWKPGRKGNEHEIIDLERLPEIWGVAEPGQIIDMLGLMGDASDNIPGIPGIGPKTAKKLIAEFGSMENLHRQHREAQGQAKGTRRNPRRSGAALQGTRHHHHRCAGARHLGRPRALPAR